MKNILIIGYGFVGKSVEFSLSLKSSSFSFTIFDPVAGHDTDFSNWTDMDAIFICIPTPTGIDGSCDYSIVKHYAELFSNATCPVIIKSTVVPSGVKELVEINRNVVYVPEFLTEKNWKEDSVSAKNIIIGTDSLELFQNIADLFKEAKLSGTCLKVSPEEASLFKYASNTFLAMKVVYMHEMYKWLDRIDSKAYNTVAHLMSMDPRLGTSHYKAPGDHGLGYSGTCFPKDTLALSVEAEGNLPLLEAVIARNKSLRKSAK